MSGFGAQIRMGKESKDAKAVIDGDDDRAFTRQRLAVVRACSAKASGKASAVDPYHHWQAVFGGFGGRPDIQVKAIFAKRRQHGLIDGCCWRIRSLPAGI